MTSAWCPAPGRRRSPDLIEPCRAALREKAPSGRDWVQEIKFDGYRTVAALPGRDLILDGEAVVVDSRGIPDFGLLHADLAVGCKDRLLYYDDLDISAPRE